MKTLIILLLTFFWSITATAEQTPWQTHAPLPDSISYSNYNNQAFQQFIVRATDPSQPQWGDGVNGQLRKRAQILPAFRSPLESHKTIAFDFMIPVDWVSSSFPVLLYGAHTINLPNGPYGLYIEGDNLRFDMQIAATGSPVKTIYTARVPYVKDRLHSFRLEMHVTKKSSGYAQAFLDGNQFVNYSGPTVSADESGLPYDKLGLYVFSATSSWPFIDQQKRVFVRLK